MRRFAAAMAGLLFCTGLATPAAAAAPLRIMPLGDSITVGVGSPKKSGYRIDLQRRLRTAGAGADFVGSQSNGAGGDLDHEGRGGWTVDQIAEQIEGRLAEARPDVVLLHAGTNNITRSEDPAAVAAKLSALIDRIRHQVPGADVFVARIVGTAVASETAGNQAYNALIPGIVREKGPKVHLVDQSGVGGLDIYDAHHPNELGYLKMSYTWYEALRTTLHPEWPRTSNPFQARKAYMCHAQSRTERDCREWHRRRVIVSRAAGQTVTEERWQTARLVTETVTVWESGRQVTRTRQVSRWSNV